MANTSDTTADDGQPLADPEALAEAPPVAANTNNDSSTEAASPLPADPTGVLPSDDALVEAAPPAEGPTPSQAEPTPLLESRDERVDSIDPATGALTAEAVALRRAANEEAVAQGLDRPYPNG